jgi:hypothetical protein
MIEQLRLIMVSTASTSVQKYVTTDAGNFTSHQQSELAHQTQRNGYHEHSNFPDLREVIKSLNDSDAITAFEQRPTSSETSSVMHKLRLLDSMMKPERV